MNNDPMSYLHRSGIMSTKSVAKGVRSAPKVTTVGMAVKRPPEMNVSAGPGKGLSQGNRPIKGTGENRYGAPPKGAMNGDGWTGKKNTPSRVGKEYAGVQAESPGGNKAKSASPARGVETKSATSDQGAGAAKRVNAKGAYKNLDKTHSGMYERLEEKTVKEAGLKGPTEKVLSQGHNEKKKWIAGAIKRPGAFTAKAKKAKMSVPAFAAKMKSAPGRTGKQARLAQTLSKMRKKK